MIKLGENYRDAEASNGGTDFKRLPPGGYVCTIKKVTNYSQNEKPYLHVIYDIREGEYADFYNDEWGKENEWAHDNRHYYSEAAFGMFKGFLKAVDESNNTDFAEQAEFGLDEQRLVGKAVGYIIGEEEYESNDGSVKTRLRVRGARPVQAIREGRFKQPELKKLTSNTATVAEDYTPKPVNDDDLPF